MSEKTSNPFIFGQNGFIPLPNLIAIKDLQCRFVALTESIKTRVGFEKIEDVIGITDHNIKCTSSKFAKEFIQQDKKIMTMNQPKKLLDYYLNQDKEAILSLAEKSPIVNNGIVEGISISIIEMKLKDFNQFATWLIKNISGKRNLSANQKYKCFEIGGLLSCELKLTERQKEVLFLMLHGKRSNDIAEELFISKRTVEGHINGLKDKFNCQNKTALIEKAICEGYLNLIPTRFFNKLL